MNQRRTFWMAVATPAMAGVGAWAIFGPTFATAAPKVLQRPSPPVAERWNPPPVRTPPKPPTQLRVRAIGDVMLGTLVPAGHLAEDDAAGLLQPVTTWLRDADVTFANLEGPLCDEGITTKCGPSSTACYAFRSPERYALHLQAAGIDVVSTANNHSGDYGEACRRTTETTLDASGIAWSGPPGTVATVDVQGARVAVVAFHANPECNNLNDPAAAARLVAQAAATHTWTLVSFHGGAEGSDRTHVPDEMEWFHGEARGHLRAFARTVIEAGADLVVGHGPHVPRGLESVNGHLVAYSLGNFATWREFNLSGPLGLAPVLDVTLDVEGRWTEGQILSARQSGDGGPVPDPTGTAAALMAKLSAQDFGPTAPRFAADGRISPPPTP